MAPSDEEVGMGVLQKEAQVNPMVKTLAGAIEYVARELNTKSEATTKRDFRFVGFLTEKNGEVVYPLYAGGRDSRELFVAGGKGLGDVYQVSYGAGYDVDWGGMVGHRSYPKADRWVENGQIGRQSTDHTKNEPLESGVITRAFPDIPGLEVDYEDRVRALLSQDNKPPYGRLEMVANGLRKAAGWESLPVPQDQVS